MGTISKKRNLGGRSKKIDSWDRATAGILWNKEEKTTKQGQTKLKGRLANEVELKLRNEALLVSNC